MYWGLLFFHIFGGPKVTTSSAYAMSRLWFETKLPHINETGWMVLWLPTCHAWMMKKVVMSVMGGSGKNEEGRDKIRG